MVAPTLTPLPTYFAVQLHDEEPLAGLAQAILETAQSERILFRHLEACGSFTMGSARFTRFRTDIETQDAVRRILGILLSQGRGIVSVLKTGTYELRLASGRTTQISNLLLHAVPKPGEVRRFQGTRLKRWAEQFTQN